MRKTKPDTSLAIKTGHFNLLTTARYYHRHGHWRQTRNAKQLRFDHANAINFGFVFFFERFTRTLKCVSLQ